MVRPMPLRIGAIGGQSQRPIRALPMAGNEPMYSIFEDAGGIFWMGGNGIGRWDTATGIFTDFWNWQNSNLPADGIKAIVKRQGTVWGGSAGSGAYWLNGNDWIHVTLSPGGYNYSFNNVYTMSVDTENNLWVGSEYGLRKFVAGQQQYLHAVRYEQLAVAQPLDLRRRSGPERRNLDRHWRRVGPFRRDKLDDLQSGKHRNARYHRV
jgi:ligand-binding sensor domain-containing protein